MINSWKRKLLIQAEHIKIDSEMKNKVSINPTFEQSLKKKDNYTKFPSRRVHKFIRFKNS